MMGVVNANVRSFIISEYGDAAWAKVVEVAEMTVEGSQWIGACPYADGVTIKLFVSANQALGVPIELLLEGYGLFFIASMCRSGYDSLLQALGSDMACLLRNLNQLHYQMLPVYPLMQAPQFRCEKVTETSCEVHYMSNRTILAPFVRGLLHGLGVSVFHIPVEVELIRSRQDGTDDHEVFVVSYPAHGRFRRVLSPPTDNLAQESSTVSKEGMPISATHITSGTTIPRPDLPDFMMCNTRTTSARSRMQSSSDISASLPSLPELGFVDGEIVHPAAVAAGSTLDDTSTTPARSAAVPAVAPSLTGSVLDAHVTHVSGSEQTADAATVDTSIGLSPAMSKTLFPFAILMDCELRVLQVGAVLSTLYPELQPGAYVADSFQVVHPVMELPAFDTIVRDHENVFILRHKRDGLELRGQMVPVTRPQTGWTLHQEGEDSGTACGLLLQPAVSTTCNSPAVSTSQLLHNSEDAALLASSKSSPYTSPNVRRHNSYNQVSKPALPIIQSGSSLTCSASQLPLPDHGSRSMPDLGSRSSGPVADTARHPPSGCPFTGSVRGESSTGVPDPGSMAMKPMDGAMQAATNALAAGLAAMGEAESDAPGLHPPATHQPATAAVAAGAASDAHDAFRQLVETAGWAASGGKCPFISPPGQSLRADNGVSSPTRMGRTADNRCTAIDSSSASPQSKPPLSNLHEPDSLSTFAESRPASPLRPRTPRPAAVASAHCLRPVSLATPGNISSTVTPPTSINMLSTSTAAMLRQTVSARSVLGHSAANAAALREQGRCRFRMQTTDGHVRGTALERAGLEPHNRVSAPNIGHEVGRGRRSQRFAVSSDGGLNSSTIAQLQQMLSGPAPAAAAGSIRVSSSSDVTAEGVPEVANSGTVVPHDDESSPAASVTGKEALVTHGSGNCDSNGYDSRALLFMCSPKVGSLAELTKHRLFMSDIPLHDMSRDFVLMNMQRQGEAGLTALLERMAADLQSASAQLVEAKEHLESQRKKTDSLLYRMLPPFVAEQLRTGQRVVPTTYPEVTILFAEVVGYQPMVMGGCISPQEVYCMLNNLYTRFDALVDQFPATYKIETIGDAYMLVCNLTTPCDDHVDQVIDFAIRMQAEARHVLMADQPVRMQVGVHTGSVVGGVMGTRTPRFCLIGDTVNTASRMQSHGMPDEIHISDAAYARIRDCGKYAVRGQGIVPIKGKGDMQTYFVGPPNSTTSRPFLTHERSPTVSRSSVSRMGSMRRTASMLRRDTAEAQPLAVA